MSKSIDQLVDSLPTEGLTIRVLGLLDYITPGQWQNVTGFDNTIQMVTGESDPGMVSQIRNRALQLYGDTSQGYQRAITIYQTVDNVDVALGAAGMAHRIGEKIPFLSFLEKVTPQQEKSQALNLAMKLVAEAVGFCYTNGFPGDGIGDFLSAVGSYEKENLIRMSAIVTFDGLVPLGPDFATKLMRNVREMNVSDIEQSTFFKKAKDILPGGGSAGEALSYVTNAVGSMESYVGSFAGQHGITLDGILGGLKGFVDFSDDKLDYVAAFLAMSTNYVEHTGTQSVARSLIERAVGDI